MSVLDDLVPLLKKTPMSGLLQSLELRLRQAVDDNLSHEEFLDHLINDEAERREAKQLHQRVRRASFEHQKTLEDFDFRQSAATESTGHRAGHLRICGPETQRLAGRTNRCGKESYCTRLGHRACRLGHRVLYTSATAMLRDLRAARADASYDRKLARFASVDLLIIGDLGLCSLTDDEPIDLSEVIRQRYEKAPPSSPRTARSPSWRLFRDLLLASAALDPTAPQCQCGGAHRSTHIETHLRQLSAQNPRESTTTRRRNHDKATMARPP